MLTRSGPMARTKRGVDPNRISGIATASAARVRTGASPRISSLYRRSAPAPHPAHLRDQAFLALLGVVVMDHEQGVDQAREVEEQREHDAQQGLERLPTQQHR